MIIIIIISIGAFFLSFFLYCTAMRYSKIEDKKNSGNKYELTNAMGEKKEW